MVASLYFVQPIADLVAIDLEMARPRVGLLTTLPLAGYGVGLLLLAPLGDLVENRLLILGMVGAEAVALFALAMAHHSVPFLTASFAAGLSASSIQVILPYTSHLVAGPHQGRALARLVSGVMLGILLARPTSSFMAEAFAWRTVYFASAAVMTSMTIVLAVVLVPRRPSGAMGYVGLVTSMFGLLGANEILRRRALYQAAMFGAFIAFWTAIPLWLAQVPFSLSQGGIARVALAGVAGAVVPPFANRLVDAGRARVATVAAMSVAISAMVLTLFARSGSVATVVVAAVLLDAAVSANLVFGQRAIYALAAEHRSRVNALFIAFFFAAGAAASAVSGWAFARFGWGGVVGVGAGLPALALPYCLTEG